jgi:hypothetical protein
VTCSTKSAPQNSDFTNRSIEVEHLENPARVIMVSMNLSRYRSEQAVARRVVASAVVTVFSLVGAQLLAPMAGASTVPTTELGLVHVTSSQALPPPYKPRQIFLETKAALAAFGGALHVDNIGVHLPPNGPGGCAGGTQYTVEVTYKTGHKVSMYAYECGGAVTGDLTGNVKAFVKYLSTVVR